MGDNEREIINKDFELQMKEVCNWDKRKLCDSLYIKNYNKALQEIVRLRKLLAEKEQQLKDEKENRKIS